MDKLIVALDVGTAKEARGLVKKLHPPVNIFKVGLQIFTACGPGLVKDITETGAKVFLDLKLHDIPNTVAGAAASIAKLGVSMFTIHASGGLEMMQAAVKGAEEAAAELKVEKPLILAVTVLTSMKDSSKVGELVELAKKAGCDGVICSPLEAAVVRKECGEDFVIVTPGIRLSGAGKGDQKRIATPSAAVMAGANYIVVGRPITKAPDLAWAAVEIIKEIGQ